MAISMISAKENIKNVEEFNYLYDAVGWGSYDNDVSKIALDNTLYSVSIYDDGKIIGYKRFICECRRKGNFKGVKFAN